VTAKPTARRKIVLRVLGFFLVAYLALCVGGRLGYRVLLYPAPNDPEPRVPAGASMLVLRASDGAPVRALQIPPPNDRSRTIVIFHGNAETIGSGVDLAEDLHHRGLGVVLAEYRGYGVSRTAGRPSEPAFYGDAEAILDALQAQGIAADRTVVMGISLGTGVAAEMARRGRSAALVLFSPYTSITAMARQVAPFLPASFICPDAFDTLSKAGEIRVPTLVVHGDQDEVISVAMGRAVAAAIPGADLKILAGGHHNDLFVYWHRELIDALVVAASR
jgi:alpha-beta hydrolase superfamily lysophospholipase